uniref:DDE-1 domain-containing protein n=1 Tax=Phytophthora ramorum TaxID=164328 RepID=H3H557_PHYRM
MDRTSVRVDVTPHSTIEFVGARTVDVVQSTTPDSFRASVFLCASATGRKLRSMVAVAGAPGTIVHDELKEDMHYDWDRGYYTVQAKAYCDKRVMIEWIDTVWAPTIQAQKWRHIAASVLQAWDKVDAESIRNGFLKASLVATGPRDARGVFATPKQPSEGVVEES